MRSLSHILTLLIAVVSLNPEAITQATDLNSGVAMDDYSALRNTFIQPFDETDPSKLKFEFRLFEKKVAPVHLFIGVNDFKVKCNLDIYNHIISGDFKKIGEIVEYQYNKSALDSLYLLDAKNELVIEKYQYNGKLDLYAKVVHEGHFIIVESFQFEFQKGVINPILDSGTYEDKIVVKKKDYLNDSGIWWEIPKQKKDLIDFIQTHYKKSTDKSTLKGRKAIDVIIAMN